ncbi:MAG: hypothetical protein K1X49_07750 [Saprospiraceae bacterium]|jgi:O-glycosyl hydrolase|nr:hypothetical protein [Saprospiraceae bacterium]
MISIRFCLKIVSLMLLVPNTDDHIFAQTTLITVNSDRRFQTIDGFGAHESSLQVNTTAWQQLFFDKLGASMYRVDLTPRLKSPYSDLSYYSPWFMGSQVRSVFNLEDQSNPNGPENNRVRTYTGPADYSRLFGGRSAPIAVMGPDIEKNLTYFVYSPDGAIAAGLQRAKAGESFKLIGSLWSPVPWVKQSSGNRYGDNWWPGPVANQAWPFIWGGNFAGGKLDLSETALAVFDDKSQGGTGPTSSLTQFVRSTAAYILGFQRFHQIKLAAISIQNELNFEQFYNSATYPLASQYVKAVKAVRIEFDKHPELKDIQIMGPEDLLGGDAYGMWEYGGPVHKNLQYIQAIESDSAASRAVSFYCVHGYDNNGVSSSGANSSLWNWWYNGWNTRPAPGLPNQVKGVSSYGKKSWMTETSGENSEWLAPVSGFPSNGGWSIALKLHQALTVGMQSAWLYWNFTEEAGTANVGDQSLTTVALGENSPKYAAFKHFCKWIRPGYQRTEMNSNSAQVVASSFVDPQNLNWTSVLINTSTVNQAVIVRRQGSIPLKGRFRFISSDSGKLLDTFGLIPTNGDLTFSMKPFSVITINGKLDQTTDSEIADKSNVLSCKILDGKLVCNGKINLSEIKKLRLYNLHGAKMMEMNDYGLSEMQNRVSFEAELPEMNSGMYFLEFVYGARSHIQRIVYP